MRRASMVLKSWFLHHSSTCAITSHSSSSKTWIIQCWRGKESLQSCHYKCICIPAKQKGRAREFTLLLPSLHFQQHTHTLMARRCVASSNQRCVAFIVFMHETLSLVLRAISTNAFTHRPRDRMCGYRWYTQFFFLLVLLLFSMFLTSCPIIKLNFTCILYHSNNNKKKSFCIKIVRNVLFDVQFYREYCLSLSLDVSSWIHSSSSCARKNRINESSSRELSAAAVNKNFMAFGDAIGRPRKSSLRRAGKLCSTPNSNRSVIVIG